MNTLYQALEQAVHSFASQTAVIDYPTQRRLDYTELLEDTRRLHAELMQRTPVQAGDRVGLLIANEIHFITAFFALQALGAVVIPLSWRLTGAELNKIIANAGMSGLVVSPDYRHLVTDSADNLNWLVLTDSEEATAPDPLRPAFVIETLAPTEESATSTTAWPAQPDDLAVLVYTSGTTGTPKGVMLSHKNLLADANANSMVIEATPNDVFVTTSPLFHVFGLTNVMLTALTNGAAIVLIRRFNPKSVLDAISRYRVTFLAAVPTMYQMILALMPNPAYDLSSLRVCHSGAAPMPTAIFHRIEALFDAPVQEGYGQSEASSIMTSNPLHGPRKPGSIGLPLPGVTIEVVDENGQPLPPFEIGELRAQGDTVMLGYWQNPDATARTLRQGWLYTRDMGYTDNDGYLFLRGRSDDLINVGGAKVYPQEVEDTLYQHPHVAACAVKAEHSDLYHEHVAAYIVPAEGITLVPQDLQKFCRLTLAEYKIPKAIYTVPDIPKGATGKILRYHLIPPEDPSQNFRNGDKN